MISFNTIGEGLDSRCTLSHTPPVIRARFDGPLVRDGRRGAAVGFPPDLLCNRLLIRLLTGIEVLWCDVAPLLLSHRSDPALSPNMAG